ncbi:hypothetical protein PFICI_14785 [Pestalotiopsis fici W106-1]|uniref:Xylanolytic transcriptional activator regulatory domain-containing protein n=1 Tax=Pestalotiopsis fici (strain W106-1 / CGMCC3.15140) TaxID=1229662 RepID=W3WJA0_PESFW|nr:uncharacterized protein PFICI_14785 [Pestalotiopsis fici W106-1]ETS73839.1 hypothetical protein PFICI_14785 [Pestalotiopsis fici W106-1]
MDRLRLWMDNVRSFLGSSYFDGHHKKKVHIVQLLLVVLMIILSGTRVAVKPKGIPTTRADTIGIVMGIKTFVVITYQLVTTHVQRYKKWASLKAYSVLNFMEILFWFVVIIVTFMGISTFCQGASCGLSWIIVLLAVALICIETGLECVASTRAQYTRRRYPAVPDSATTQSISSPAAVHRNVTGASGPVPSFGQYVRVALEIVIIYLMVMTAHRNLWQGLSDEVRDSRLGVYSATLTALEGPSSDASALLLSSAPRDSGYQDLYPSAAHASILWQSFLQNVNPLSKVIHAPTMQSYIIEAGRGPATLDRPTVALLFAIYTAAVMSMSDVECQNNFGKPQKTLLSSYLFATQQALQVAELMRTPSFMLLQAFTLYIIAARHLCNPQNTWLLSGTAVRMGQLLGLHQNPPRGDLSIFEIQMHRRLWWQILLIDGRGAQLAGSQSTQQFSNAADFWLPGNFNDADLGPDMLEEPAVHNGPTEVIFCLLRYELGRFLSTAAPILYSREMSLEEKDRLINEYEDRIESKYLRYCDMASPLHLVASGGARSALCKMRLMAHHPSQYACGTSIPESEHDMLFFNSLKMVEYDVLGKSIRSLDSFGWHTDVFFQLDAFVFMLIELRRQKLGPDVEKAWRLIDDVFRHHPTLSGEGSSELSLEVSKLVLKAWKTREASLVETGIVPVQKPPIITQLRSRLRADSEYDFILDKTSEAAKQQFTNVDMDASMMVDWDFWDNFLQGDGVLQSQDFMNST